MAINPPSIATLSYLAKGLSTVVGIVGGLLGAYTFIDTYILHFRPKFIIGDRIYLIYRNNNANYTYLSSLVIQFEIFNHRNKLGRIEDVFVRIYDSRQLEASILDLFPIATLDEMPLSREEVTLAKRVPPAPMAVLNKSSRTLTLELAQEKLSHGAISPSAYLNFEARYKNSSGKWKRFAKISLHAEYEENSIHGDATVYNFSPIDRFSEREKLRRRRIRTQVNSYHGVAGFYISIWLGKLRWVAKSIAFIPPKIIDWVLSFGLASLNGAKSEFIEWPITLSKSSKNRRPRVTVGNAHHARETGSFLAKIGSNLQEKIERLNGRDTQNNQITIKICEKEILVIKNNSQIKVYYGGDGFIGVHQSPVNSSKGEMVFTLKIRQYPLHKFGWMLSGKPVFSSTVATRVLDYLSLLASM